MSELDKILENMDIESSICPYTFKKSEDGRVSISKVMLDFFRFFFSASSIDYLQQEDFVSSLAKLSKYLNKKKRKIKRLKWICAGLIGISVYLLAEIIKLNLN